MTPRSDHQRFLDVTLPPGCPFCASLRHRLRRTGLAFEEINIRKDPAAASLVRSVAQGNETVPTVFVDGTALINPSAREVLRLAAGAADKTGLGL